MSVGLHVLDSIIHDWLDPPPLRAPSKASDDEKVFGDPANIFFTSKFSYLLFYNPTHKTQIGTANTWGTTNNKPSRPIIMMGHSKTLSSSHIAFITFFTAGARYYCGLEQPP